MSRSSPSLCSGLSTQFRVSGVFFFFFLFLVGARVCVRLHKSTGCASSGVHNSPVAVVLRREATAPRHQRSNSVSACEARSVTAPRTVLRWLRIPRERGASFAKREPSRNEWRERRSRPIPPGGVRVSLKRRICHISRARHPRFLPLFLTLFSASNRLQRRLRHRCALETRRLIGGAGLRGESRPFPALRHKRSGV